MVIAYHEQSAKYALGLAATKTANGRAVRDLATKNYSMTSQPLLADEPVTSGETETTPQLRKHRSTVDQYFILKMETMKKLADDEATLSLKKRVKELEYKILERKLEKELVEMDK